MSDPPEGGGDCSSSSGDGSPGDGLSLARSIAHALLAIGLPGPDRRMDDSWWIGKAEVLFAMIFGSFSS